MKNLLFILAFIPFMGFGQYIDLSDYHNKNVLWEMADSNIFQLRTAVTANGLWDDSIAVHRTDIDLKAPIASPTFTGTITIGDAGISEAELEILDGATLSTDELNYVDGVTSAIQTQLGAKQDTTDAINAYTLFEALTDTSLYFNVTIGIGNAGDTVGFPLDSVI